MIECDRGLVVFEKCDRGFVACKCDRGFIVYDGEERSPSCDL
jgi:hypothetical protein